MLNQIVFPSVLFFTCRAEMTERGGFHATLSIRCLQKSLAVRGLNRARLPENPEVNQAVHPNTYNFLIIKKLLIVDTFY